MRKLLSFLAPLAFLAAGSNCGNNAANLNSKDAVKKAIVEHLAKRKGLDLDMSAMEVEVGEVSFKANEAEASVSFRAKGAATSAMSMQYQLERVGDTWKVKPKAPGAAGANPHGAGGESMAPAVELPAPLPGQGGGAMPPGHPPVAPKEGAPGAKK